MKKILTRFFVLLGVVCFLSMVYIGYLWYTDREVLIMHVTACVAQQLVKDVVHNVPEHVIQQDTVPSILSEEQEQALKKANIDPSTMPTSFTEEQVRCFKEKLGEDRVRDVQNGGALTATELFTARTCVE